MRKTVAIAVVLAVTLGAVGQDGKQELKRINVDFTVGWGNCYRPMCWTPLLVGISTPFKKPMDCVIRISAAQNDLNRLDISRREVLMPGRPKDIPLVTKLAYGVDKCEVSIYSRQTGFFWSKTYEIWQGPSERNPVEIVESKDALIAVSGKQGFGIMRMSQHSQEGHPQDGEYGKVLVKYRFQRVLPVDWTAYASLDLLVLYDADWLQLSDHQTRAILQWVHNGGRLMLVLGAQPLPAGHPLAKALPFRIDPPQEVVLPNATLRGWGLSTTGRAGKKVSCWTLTGAAQAPRWQASAAGDDIPLRAWGPVGFGRIAVLAFDPAALGNRPATHSARFWRDQMGEPIAPRTLDEKDNDSSDSGYWGQYRTGKAHQGANAVLEYLYAMDELRPIHIGWVVLVLAVLAVLIGPVDYLVLKKAGRLPLTWLTASLCIALFSVGAYYGVQYLRGGVLQARVVSVTDGVHGAPGAWSTRYVGVFSPRSAEYRLTGLNRGQWWSGMAPTEESLYHFREQLGSRNLYCQQHIDGGNVPISVPINIWSMQCMLSEAPAADMPFTASVRHDRARGEIVVDVENFNASAIRGGYVLLANRRSVPFGGVPPKAARQFRGKPQHWETWESYANRVRQNDQTAAVQAARWRNQTPYTALGTRRRTDAVFDYLKAGAAAVCVEFDNAPVPFDIEGRTCIFQHTALARLVVFPERN